MAGTFQILHSNDLIRSRILRVYQMGKRPPMTDMMAWNADTCTEYLRRLFLNNDLAEGQIRQAGQTSTNGRIKGGACSALPGPRPIRATT